MKIPLENKLQAIETILDSESQKTRNQRLQLALRFVRSVQRELFGKHYVRELSLKRYLKGNPVDPLSKRNYRKYKRQQALKQNKRIDKS